MEQAGLEMGMEMIGEGDEKHNDYWYMYIIIVIVFIIL